MDPDGNDYGEVLDEEEGGMQPVPPSNEDGSINLNDS